MHTYNVCVGDFFGRHGICRSHMPAARLTGLTPIRERSMYSPASRRDGCSLYHVGDLSPNMAKVLPSISWEVTQRGRGNDFTETFDSLARQYNHFENDLQLWGVCLFSAMLFGVRDHWPSRLTSICVARDATNTTTDTTHLFGSSQQGETPLGDLLAYDTLESQAVCAGHARRRA